MGPQKLGVDGKDLAKLYERQIQASLIAVNDCLVVFFYGLIQAFQLLGLFWTDSI